MNMGNVLLDVPLMMNVTLGLLELSVMPLENARLVRLTLELSLIMTLLNTILEKRPALIEMNPFYGDEIIRSLNLKPLSD